MKETQIPQGPVKRGAKRDVFGIGKGTLKHSQASFFTGTEVDSVAIQFQSRSAF